MPSAPTLDLGNLLVHLKADASQYNRVFGGATKTLTNFTKLIKWSGVAITAYAIASVKAFASFDDAMTRSLAIMGDVSKNMRKQMEMVALTISKRSTVTARDLGKAYFYLASAGLDVQQSMAALEPMMRFAVAGQFDMARATELATDAQSALGLKVKNAIQNQKNLIKVTDTLVGANTLADATTEQFAEALATQAGSTMKAYKISLNEGVAVLAAYAEQGRKASDAGTLFSRMIRLTMQGFRDHRTAWQRLNIDIFDAQGNLRHLGDIINDLTNAMGNMSPRMKGIQLDLLGFQARSQQAILPILGMGDAIKEWNKDLDDMSKITREVFEKQIKSWNSQLKILWNQITATAIAIGEKLAPNLEALNEWYRNNEGVILNWALYFADRINFVKDVMFDFVKFMKEDWAIGFQTVLDFFIDILEVAGRLAVKLSIKIGQGIWKGINEGLLKANEDLIRTSARMLFESWGGKIGRVPLPSRVKVSKGLLDLPAYVSKDQLALYQKALEAVTEQVNEDMIKNIIPAGFAESAKEELGRFVVDISTEGPSMRFFDTYEKRLAELIVKDKERVAAVKALKQVMEEVAVTDMKKPFEEASGIAEVLGENFERFQTAMQEWADDAENKYVNLANVVSTAFDNLSQTITRMVMTGKADFSAFAKSVLADLLTMIIRARLAQAAMQIIPGFAQFFPGYMPAVPVTATPGAFASPHGGPAFPSLQHGGEVKSTGLAVVHEGERFSGVDSNLTPPTIIINNNTGTRIKQQGAPRMEAGKWIINTIIDDVEHGGDLFNLFFGGSRG